MTKRQKTGGRKRFDFIGIRIGKIYVIEYVGKSIYKCICDCGNECLISSTILKKKKRNSCGCDKFHGLAKTRFYNIYCHIYNRCNRKENDNYKRYGGRGIKNLWERFIDFKNDMYDSYLKLSKEIGESNVSIDRISNSGNYCKGNCRWIHISKQQENRDCNHYIEYNGKINTISGWAKEIGIKEGTLRMRIIRYGWSIEKSIETKIRVRSS